MAWSYTENFDSYNIGTLVGQGGWTEYSSGQPDWMVVNAPAGAQGGKSIEFQNTSEGTEYKTSLGLTDTSGKVYMVILFESDSTTNGTLGFQARWGGITPKVRFGAYSNNGTSGYGFGFYGSASWEWNSTKPVINTWYIVELDMSSTQGRCRFRQWGSGSWSDYSTWKNNEGGTTDMNSVYLNVSSLASYGVHIDLISSEEPDVFRTVNVSDSVAVTESVSVYGGLNNAIVSHWRFDEVSGGAADAVGGYNLTNTNTATFTSGKFFNCTDLNGSNQFFTNTAWSAPANDFSVSAWIKLDTDQDSSIFTDNWASATNAMQFLYQASNNRLYCRWWDNSTNDTAGYTADNTIPSTDGSTWYHVVVSVDVSAGISGMKFYINGSSSATTTSTNNASSKNANTHSCFIGGNHASSQYFAGNIDEVSYWNRAVTEDEVATLYNSGSGMYFLDGGFVTSANTKNQNLASYWKLDESSGNAYDAHNSNDLTNNNTVPFVSHGGNFNNAADLERDTSHYFSITDATQSGLDFSSAFSLSCWVKPESQPSSDIIYTIISKSTNTTSESYRCAYWNQGGTYKLQLVVEQNGNGTAQDVLAVNYTLSNATWYHVVMTWTGTTKTAKFYVNGSQTGGDQTGTNAATTFNSSAAFQVGALTGFGGGPWYFDGVIDEIGVWSRVLTSSEVTSLYNSGDGLKYPFLTSDSSEYFETVTITESVTGYPLFPAEPKHGVGLKVWPQ